MIDELRKDAVDHLSRAYDANRRRLAKLVEARTKLDVASRLAKEATVAISGLSPVEVREELQQIAATIDSYIQRRLTIIELIPST